MRKLAFRYRRVKELYNTYKNNVGGESFVTEKMSVTSLLFMCVQRELFPPHDKSHVFNFHVSCLKEKGEIILTYKMIPCFSQEN